MKEEIKIVLERQHRRNNVVIQSLKLNNDNQKDIVEEMKKFIKNELEIDVKIKAARKIRNYT